MWKNLPLCLFCLKEKIATGFQMCGFPCSSVGKESACSAEDLGLIPGLGRSPGEGNGNSLQYPCLENLMDRGAWWAAVHGVAKSWARLNDEHNEKNSRKVAEIRKLKKKTTHPTPTPQSEGFEEITRQAKFQGQDLGERNPVK